MSKGKRRIDRISQPDFVAGLDGLDLTELRERRDECREELEHLSMLRRYVQSRAEILRGELDLRRGNGEGSLIENLAEILASDDHPAASRGAAIRLQAPDEEMLLARRRVEKLVADAGVTDPGALTDEELEAAVAELAQEERAVSTDRSEVIRVLEVLQDELKRRFKEDPASAIA